MGQDIHGWCSNVHVHAVVGCVVICVRACECLYVCMCVCVCVCVCVGGGGGCKEKGVEMYLCRKRKGGCIKYVISQVQVRLCINALFDIC